MRTVNNLVQRDSDGYYIEEETTEIDIKYRQSNILKLPDKLIRYKLYTPDGKVAYSCWYKKPSEEEVENMKIIYKRYNGGLL